MGGKGGWGRERGREGQGATEMLTKKKMTEREEEGAVCLLGWCTVVYYFFLLQ